ncbi:hypothetical protein ACMYSP_24625 [Klebsiella sp. R390]|uniref:hypothetical protein n=1 Tax=Klebsiella sp. R390 TaxID=2755400 RepID=UPI003DA7F6AE
MHSEDLKEKTLAWFNYITSPANNEDVFMRSSQDILVMNPAIASATQEYIEGNIRDSQLFNTASSAPQTMYDGLQTIVNLCRVQSGYNALDPNGTGSKAYFTKFTQNIANVPCLTLLSAETKNIKQQSHNADELINSFVDAFDGLTQSDQSKIKSSVTSLVKAALSYANEEQKSSNFTQNILQTGDDQVIFTLYASTFEISSTKSKGVISFKSEYSLQQALYSLSRASWERVKDMFAEQEKTTMEQWLNDMKTPQKSDSTVKALCLE